MQHIYVIVRVDLLADDRLVIDGDIATWEHANDATYGPLPHGITGTKAYLSLDDARREAERLNAAKRGKRQRYFVTIARLQESDLGTVRPVGVEAFWHEGRGPELDRVHLRKYGVGLAAIV